MLLNITIITTLICQTYEICSFEMSLNNGSFYLNHSIFILLCQQMKNIRNYYYGFIVCVCICLSFCSSVCSCFSWRIIFVFFFQRNIAYMWLHLFFNCLLLLYTNSIFPADKSTFWSFINFYMFVFVSLVNMCFLFIQ